MVLSRNLKDSVQDLLKRRIATCWASFWIRGSPNGDHLCLLLPVPGPSLDGGAYTLSFNRAKLKSVCRQATEAMEYLHGKGICHGDFRPDNIVFQTQNLDNLTELEIIELYGGGPYTIKSYQHLGDNPPKRRVALAFEFQHNSAHVSSEVAINKFQQSFRRNETKNWDETVDLYTAPEAAISNRYGTYSDLWALACSIYQIRTGLVPFFESSGLVDLLRAWEDFAGVMPDNLRAELHPLTASRYFPNGPADMILQQWRAENMEGTGVADTLRSRMLSVRQFVVVDDEDNTRPQRTVVLVMTGESFKMPGYKLRSWCMPKEEAQPLVGFFRKVFVWNPGPQGRLSAAEMPNDPCMEMEDADNEEYGFLTITQVNELSKNTSAYCVIPITPTPVRAVRTEMLVRAAWDDTDSSRNPFANY